MKTCSIKGCDRKFHARGWCNMHHERWRRTGDSGEAEPRKLPNGTFSRFVNGKRIWTNKTITRQEYDRRYRIRTGYKSIRAMHKKRFGGLRQAVLERDNYTCQVCGMTEREHRQKWNCQITIDHIDMTGRYSEVHNHTMDNLWTLCLSDHGRKDVLKYLLSKGKPVSREFIEIYQLDA